MRVESRCNLRLGRASPFVLAPFVVGVAWVCAEPGSLLAALDGEEEGGPALLVALVWRDTLGFLVFVAVPVGFDIAAICWCWWLQPRRRLRYATTRPPTLPCTGQCSWVCEGIGRAHCRAGSDAGAVVGGAAAIMQSESLDPLADEELLI